MQNWWAWPKIAFDIGNTSHSVDNTSINGRENIETDFEDLNNLFDFRF